MLGRVRERQCNKKNKHRVPATYQEGDWVLVHHSRLPAWPRSTSDDPYFGPYKILLVDGHRITVQCSPRLGGTLVCAAQHLKRYYDPRNVYSVFSTVFLLLLLLVVAVGCPAAGFG